MRAGTGLRHRRRWARPRPLGAVLRRWSRRRCHAAADTTQLAVGEQADFDRAKAALDSGDFRSAADLFATFTETYTGGPLTGRGAFLRGEALAGLGETIRRGARLSEQLFRGPERAARAGCPVAAGRVAGRSGPDARGLRDPGRGRHTVSRRAAGGAGESSAASSLAVRDARARWVTRVRSQALFSAERRPTALGLAVSGGSDSPGAAVPARGRLETGCPVARRRPWTMGCAPKRRPRRRVWPDLCRLWACRIRCLPWRGWDGAGNLQDQARRARYRLLSGLGDGTRRLPMWRWAIRWTIRPRRF